MCNGIVDNLGPLYAKVVRNMDFTRPYAAQLASFAFIRTCPHPSLGEAQFRLPEPKPHILDKPSNRTTRILHLTDWHFDPLYKEGSEADCRRATCCQEDSNEDESNPSLIKKPASKWGEYKCDIPRATLESMLDYIRQLHKTKPFDIVLFTGDIPAHDMWKESIEKSKYTTEITINILKSYLNDLPGVKFYPVVGNHESIPANMFPLNGQEEEKGFFLYPFLANQWKSWLPESAFNLAKQTGYYSVKHNNNLKIISLNNNLCYAYNPLLLLDPEVSDPNRMFTWLINELEDAEKSGSKVYIASHVPPASADCFQKFSITWHKIVKAYSHLIVGQFYGHNHYDEFEIYYKEGVKSKDTAISNSFLAPSVTTHVNHNPGFRLYDVDPSNYLIRDYTQYYANLNEKLNWNNGPEWKPLYSAKSAYPVPLSNGTYINGPFWHEVTELFENQKSYWDRYLFLKYKGSGYMPKCDGTCRKNLICNLRASNSKQLCSYDLDF
ncbi:sphingomyelin phosphodiesterase [Conidiobolus coronatus NRRL 28638]|uniref:Sphingomyelin phosphodiesterase n=1 Tax=Conidiobolus coronatus (strain ATCC 28846 / CBS 209.66 / NRRL 28638) TaxID=796925 RepID=A0A137PF62_CONC2|nr:sphingomyelin phosphodiesterase [Conidiobolus coronatus NRRL 28638]|eukprot:KXN73627.1 sphingomyelin phosphodiesterase [Conidiobolus coronatus NRRL 28638]